MVKDFNRKIKTEISEYRHCKTGRKSQWFYRINPSNRIRLNLQVNLRFISARNVWLKRKYFPDSDFLTNLSAAPAIAPLNPYNFTPKPQVQPNIQPSINLGLNQTLNANAVNNKAMLSNINTTFNKPAAPAYASTPNYTLNTQSYGQIQTNPSQSLLPQNSNYTNNSQSLLQPLNSNNKANNNRDAKPSGLTAQEIMDFLN